MSQISELDFFVTLSKNQSLAAAARDLDVTPSAVTKRLALMEERLGVRLVNRTTRKLSLTTEGEVYLSHAITILADIEEMELLVSNRKETPGGLLRVNAPLGFGRRYLAPVISEFIKLYPGVEVQLTLTDTPVSLPDKSIDVVIRLGDIPDSRLVARKVADNRRLLCAAPSYLTVHGRPQLPHDLLKHNCILLRQNNQTSNLWRLTRDDRTESIKVHSKLSTNDGEVALKWALDGHGILMRAEWDLAKYVRSGRLELVLEDYATPAADIFAVYLEKANLSAKVSVFVDYLRESFLIEEAGKIKLAIW
ncbi:LysR family transcriptional regulator [Marinobacterium nitratireducens]|uniref:LysR family transcriptional regulator n=1 Tax=Marinobacterium nitratireducens TaxID=518897 RepID=A0A917ZIR1_9GAMM|nr:LysR family transcriptional regulator [Marinobacterium nitratireducens]GGO84175.1 LysR family transcriptional regulator [Marinobacterium nitratireducens]